MKRKADVDLLRRRKGTGHIRRDGYTSLMQNGVSKLVHVRIVEIILGKALPPEAIVHHADGNRANNTPTNLVVCPNQAYHILLHRRMRALDRCGNANWRLCKWCKKYDDTAKMYVWGKYAYHRECARPINNARYRRRKDARAAN